MEYFFDYFPIIFLGIFIGVTIFLFILYRKKMFEVFLRKYSVRNKISISFLFIFFISVSLIALAIAFQNYQIIENEVGNHLKSVGSSRAQHIETYFEQNIERLKLVTSRTALRKALANYNHNPNQADLDNIKNIIKDAQSSVEDLEGICILSLDGSALASTKEEYCGKDFSGEDFFIQGKERSGIYFVEEAGNFKIFASGPMLLENELIGVGLTMVKIDKLTEIVRNRVGLGKTGEALIAFYNDKNEIVFPINRLFEKDKLVAGFEDEEIAEATKQVLMGNEIFLSNTLDYRGEKVMAVSEYIDLAKLGLVVKIDRSEALSGLRNLLLFYILIMALFTIVYYFTSFFVASLLTKPLDKIRLEIRDIEKRGFKYRLKISGNDELAELSEAFKQFADRVRNSRKEINQKVKSQTEEIIGRSRDMENQQKAILNILEDVEEEKNKVGLLASDLEKFKLAVDNASDHIVITDSEGMVIYGNSVVEKITGYSVKEAFGKKVGTLWKKPMEQSYYENLWKTIKKDKKPFIGQVTNRRKNGEEYEASISIAPVLDDDGKILYFVGIERDITKEKEVDKAKTEFVSLASHQLRTPLSAIGWYAEMLLNGDAGRISPAQSEYIEEIYRGNKRMVQLVNALLDVSRLELGTFIVEPEPINIFEVADGAIEELSHKIREKKLKFSKKYDTRIKTLNLDEKLTMIIFQNLLSNSVKYTQNGGKIHLKIEKGSKYIEIEVSDNGFGIPKSQQDKIFDKLFRADNIKATDTDGTGLGLYILKQIIDQSGGKIWFSSAEGRGTKFYVRLPLSGMKERKGIRKLSE